MTTAITLPLSTTSDPMIGRRIGGYRVEALLGQGGMGKVYLLVHAGSPELRRVLKVIHDGMEKLHPEIVERFFREARAAASLRHPNIIEICDYERFPEDGQPYLVMPFLDGVDLREHVDRVGAQRGHPGRISFETALPLLLQVCAALRHAHARGIIHRDLKPSNCYVVTGDEGSGRSSPRLILLDFGIAKVLDPVLRQGDATRSRAVLGTPGFMAPEQARGYQVDHRADIYALGVLTYELLTGRRPFHGATSEDLAIQQVSTIPPAPATLIPELPGEVSELVMRCLAPVPAGRPGTVMEVAHRLIRAARNGRDVARETAPDLLSSSTVAGPTEPTFLNGAPMAGVVSRTMAATTRGGRGGRAAWIALAFAFVFGTMFLGNHLASGGDANDAMAAQTAGTPPGPAAHIADAAVALPVVPNAGAVAVAVDPVPDAGTPRETTPREVTPVAMPARVVKPPPPEPRTRAAGSGTLSIKVKPWALVWVGGRSLGQTPIHEPINAGRHWVKLQRPDGTTELVSVHIKPDRETTLARDWSK